MLVYCAWWWEVCVGVWAADSLVQLALDTRILLRYNKLVTILARIPV